MQTQSSTHAETIESASKASAATGNGASPEAPPIAGSPSPRIEGRKLRKSNLQLDARSRAAFYAMSAVLHISSLLPDFILYPLGVIGGFLGYYLDRRHVKIGMKNLSIAFPERSEDERRRILRASYVNLGRGAAEYIRLAGFFHLRLKARVKYDRLHYWEEVMRKYPGKGLVVLSAHFGNFELMACAHAMHGYQINLVHHTQRFLAGDALMTFARSAAGVEILRKHSAARAVLQSSSKRRFGRGSIRSEREAQRGGMGSLFRRTGRHYQRLGAHGGDVGGAGGSRVYRARARRTPPSHRDPGRDSDPAHRRCRSRRPRKHPAS